MMGSLTQIGTRHLLFTRMPGYGISLRIGRYVLDAKPTEQELFSDRYGSHPKLRLFGWTFALRDIPIEDSNG